jgi:hypothetical protein
MKIKMTLISRAKDFITVSFLDEDGQPRMMSFVNRSEEVGEPSWKVGTESEVDVPDMFRSIQTVKMTPEEANRAVRLAEDKARDKKFWEASQTAHALLESARKQSAFEVGTLIALALTCQLAFSVYAIHASDSKPLHPGVQNVRTK